MINSRVTERMLPAITYGYAAGLPSESKPPLLPMSINMLHKTNENPYIERYPKGTW